MILKQFKGGFLVLISWVKLQIINWTGKFENVQVSDVGLGIITKRKLLIGIFGVDEKE
jgi:hypothetical protein